MQPTILIVDDDEQFLTFIGRTLKRGGFSVLTATDGCDVSELLETTRVDVLVLDLQMPGMNGWEVIRALQEPPRMAQLKLKHGMGRPKIVVVSGRNEDETERFARHLGADVYLRKPLWGDQILTTVRDVLAH